jgi:hypothetical protein
MTGVRTDGVFFTQNFAAQVFANWPIWMVLSLVAGGILFVILGIPKLFAQLRGSLDTSRGEIQS